jgi:Oxidoreductase molybdopterin binding domain
MHVGAAPLWFTLLLMKSAPAKVRSHVAAVLAPLLVIAALVSGDHLAKPTTVYAAPDAVAAPAVLKVEGAVPTPLSLTSEDLDKMPRATAQLSADGTTTTYEGVLVYDILLKAGWQFGRGMTGKPMASYLIATGKDGYEVVFALPEIDPQFSGAKVIIADKADGAALPAREQPFRIVAPEDKMHARSIYSLVKLEVVRLRP